MSKTKMPDLLIVGAGPVGCVIAERAASVGWTALILERRPHVGGNCYDAYQDGVLVHQYGPHYFRTNDPDLVAYLSNFTGWIEGNYRVRSQYREQLYPMPINRQTLEQFYGVTLSTPEEAEALLHRIRVPCSAPKNAEEYALSQIGPDLYRAFYLGYTFKQWGRHPKELEPWLLGRLPVRTDLDDRYVQARYQIMPEAGFTSMFERMLNHPLIQVKLNAAPKAWRRIQPKIATIYTGPLDEYFSHRLGPLPWRSLEFRFERLTQEWAQPCVQINYPGPEAWTRTVEPKHVTGQKHPETIIVREYPRSQGEPYYPMPSEPARALAARYLRLAELEKKRKNVWFIGRLAEYRYFNTDEVLLRALSAFKEIYQLSKGSNGI